MSKYLLDTNILLRASDRASPRYSLAVNSVASLIAQGHECVITAQVLIEFWVVATRPVEVNGLGWSVEQTEKKINQLISQFTLIEETESILAQWLELVTRYQIKGKRTHDARLMAVAITSSLTHILTFNPKDFTLTTELIVVHPDEVEPATLE
ncbi:MAG: PIN domain-containing protein [Prochloraceae cyanobacterium]|nr:PIN domain-containing protein [Prochloraceae cyanobacterium]